MKTSELTVRSVNELSQEATSSGDISLVRDCGRAVDWLTTGAAWRGIRSRAASRVARAMTQSEAQP